MHESEILHFGTLKELLQGIPHTLIGDPEHIQFSRIGNIHSASEDEMVWLSEKASDPQKAIVDTKARFIIVKSGLNASEEALVEKCLLCVDNPKLVFATIANAFLVPKKSPGIHALADVHPEAVINPSAHIGPNSTIGKCKIGANSIIHGNVFIYDDVEVGANVEVHAGCVLGAAGSGYAKNEDGEWIPFPQIGKTIIEDRVEIGANTYVAKGALSNTHIKRGAKIGLSVCIGHNVVIGTNTIVLANTTIAGSTVVGDHCYISIAATLRNKLVIGNNAVIGMGALITKDIPEGETWLGTPAKRVLHSSEKL